MWGRDGVRFTLEGSSALVRARQISPGQNDAALAAKRRPGVARVEVSSPVKGDTNGLGNADPLCANNK